MKFACSCAMDGIFWCHESDSRLACMPAMDLIKVLQKNAVWTLGFL